MKSEEEIEALASSEELRRLIDSVRPECHFRLDNRDCKTEAVYQLDLFCPQELDTISMLACLGHRNYFVNEMLPLINGGHADDHTLTEKLLS